jgi:hypothetical protein
MADEQAVEQPTDKPATVSEKKNSIKVYILAVALVLIGLTGGVELLNSYRTGTPVNWEVMEKILDRLISLLSSSHEA